MEDIVAVAVELDSGDTEYFLTWGRIQDAVDPRPFEDLVLENSGNFALSGKAVRAKVCNSLQEASRAGGFYESFFSMCQTPIPFGEETYWPWREDMDRKMREGRELYFIG